MQHPLAPNNMKTKLTHVPGGRTIIPRTLVFAVVATALNTATVAGAQGLKAEPRKLPPLPDIEKVT
jgi:hypothetical protein